MFDQNKILQQNYFIWLLLNKVTKYKGQWRHFKSGRIETGWFTKKTDIVFLTCQGTDNLCLFVFRQVWGFGVKCLFIFPITNLDIQVKMKMTIPRLFIYCSVLIQFISSIWEKLYFRFPTISGSWAILDYWSTQKHTFREAPYICIRKIQAMLVIKWF